MSKLSRSKRLRRQRERMWKENPHCHWCGIETVLIPYGAKVKQENNAATIDHLRDKYNPEKRQEPNLNNETRRVLACFSCNVRRSAEATAKLPKEELWRRSGRFPLTKPDKADTLQGT